MKKGYKQTELGMIPEDWEVRRLGDIGEIRMCKRIFKEQTSISDAIPFYKIGTFGNVPDAFISIKLYEEYRQKYYFPKKGDILFSAAGTIGRIVVYDGKPSYFQDSNIVWIENDEQIVTNEYLFHLFNIVVWMTSEGGIVSRLYNQHIRNTRISVPPLAEQTAIASVLSDMDEYILSLERLITKKKAIKQGAMQQLLNPEKHTDKTDETDNHRLNLRKSEKSALSACKKTTWVEKKLGDIGKIITGSTPSRANDSFWNGSFVWISAQDFISKYIYDSVEKITEQGKNTCRLIPKNSILVTCIASIGLNAISKIECATNQQINSIVCYNEYNPEFVYYQINNNINALRIIAGQTAVPIINKGQFEKFELYFPPTLAEQTAIATILSDMDAEIEALQAKLSKAKLIKQGVMQQLLTGQIRLGERIKTTATKQVPMVKLKPKKTRHNDQINDAVVISFLVHHFGTVQYPLSRFRYNKFAYLLYRQAEHEAKGFHKHAAGPYKSESRYKGGEGIALKNRYISMVANPISGADAFIANENIDDALSYFREWYGITIQEWIEPFRYYTNDYLQVLTTVDESMADLQGMNKTVTLGSVKEYIGSIPQWKDKLSKPYFTDENIQKAINESFKIFGS